MLKSSDLYDISVDYRQDGIGLIQKHVDVIRLAP